jgi:cytochrome b561
MIRNTTTLWGWPAKVIHWTVMAGILILLVHGWWMTHLTPRPDRLAIYAWHSALGYDLLALTLLLLLWRWINPVLAQPSAFAPSNQLVARFEVAGLYALIVAASVMGWAIANALDVPDNHDLLGLAVPQIIGTAGRTARKLFLESHNMLSYMLGVLVGVHTVRALYNHFWKRTTSSDE